jgi:hypothetical protein
MGDSKRDLMDGSISDNGKTKAEKELGSGRMVADVVRYHHHEKRLTYRVRGEAGDRDLEARRVIAVVEFSKGQFKTALCDVAYVDLVDAADILNNAENVQNDDNATSGHKRPVSRYVGRYGHALRPTQSK